MKGDVYPVEAYDDFSVNKVLDAHWGVLHDEDVRKLSTTHNLFYMFICPLTGQKIKMTSDGHQEMPKKQPRIFGLVLLSLKVEENLNI